jgi:hypothetical protein
MITICHVVENTRTSKNFAGWYAINFLEKL